MFVQWYFIITPLQATTTAQPWLNGGCKNVLSPFGSWHGARLRFAVDALFHLSATFLARSGVTAATALLVALACASSCAPCVSRHYGTWADCHVHRNMFVTIVAVVVLATGRYHHCEHHDHHKHNLLHSSFVLLLLYLFFCCKGTAIWRQKQKNVPKRKMENP